MLTLAVHAMCPNINLTVIRDSDSVERVVLNPTVSLCSSTVVNQEIQTLENQWPRDGEPNEVQKQVSTVIFTNPDPRQLKLTVESNSLNNEVTVTLTSDTCGFCVNILGKHHQFWHTCK